MGISNKNYTNKSFQTKILIKQLYLTDHNCQPNPPKTTNRLAINNINYHHKYLSQGLTNSLAKNSKLNLKFLLTKNEFRTDYIPRQRRLLNWHEFMTHLIKSPWGFNSTVRSCLRPILSVCFDGYVFFVQLVDLFDWVLPLFGLV